MSKYKVEGFQTFLVFGAASAIESFALEQLEANAAPPEVSELTSAVSLHDIHNISADHVVNDLSSDLGLAYL